MSASLGQKKMDLGFPMVFTPSKVQCWNCDGDMTHDHQCGLLAPVSLEPESEEHNLPLCHYCCHLGSGDNPVHYYQQCLCSEKTCNCRCYCTEEQLLHRKQFFPDGFSGPMVPVDPSSQRLHTLPGSLGPLCLWQCFIWDLEYISSTQSSKRKCKN